LTGSLPHPGLLYCPFAIGLPPESTKGRAFPAWPKGKKTWGRLTPPGNRRLPASRFDCVLLIQTLQFIFDVPATLRTLYRIVKPGGVVLATFPGISPLSRDEWRESWYWGFTKFSAERLFGEVFPRSQVSVQTSGNVLATTALLYGLAAAELTQHELAYVDDNYETLIAVRAVKPLNSDT
jgi:SAM-dependent methyltransferase